MKDLIFSSIGYAKKQTGFSYLGGINTSAKLKKNKIVSGNLTYILYLAPAMESGYNVCPNSTPECRLGCLATSGRAGMEILANNTDRIKMSRINKTKLFYENNLFFMAWLIADIKAKQAKAKKEGFDFSVRLNGTSDIDWQNETFNGKNVFEHFPEVQFYDYTKQITKFAFKPENYHLTFSYSGRNVENCLKVLNSGNNVAVVFNVKNESELPKTFMGFDVFSGDITDARFLDKGSDNKGVIIGLKWKKIANKENNEAIKNSVFVVQPNDERCEY